MTNLSQIKQLVASGDQDTAIQELGRLLHADPQNVEAWLLLADLREDPYERKDCYKQVLKLDPYNEQAQLQMRLLGGMTGLKFNRPEVRRVEPPPVAEPEAAPVVAEGPPRPEFKPAPPDEGSSSAPDVLLQSLRTEMKAAAGDQPLPSDASGAESSETAEKAPIDLKETFKGLGTRVKPLPGQTFRFVAKNRLVQILLVGLGIALALLLFLIIWSRVIPVRPLATLIVGPAKNYIPAQAELPVGFNMLNTPASNTLISLPKGEGFRMVFTNPDFAALNRETSVSYEVVIYNNELDAQVDLLVASDVRSYPAGKTMEVDAIAPNLLARVDYSTLLFGSKDQTAYGGAPAISYTLVLREVNLTAKITVTAPVADTQSVAAQNLRGPLYQAVFYYASLLTSKLPLPPASQVQVSLPVFPASTAP